jgi:hypothetical protein
LHDKTKRVTDGRRSAHKGSCFRSAPTSCPLALTIEPGRAFRFLSTSKRPHSTDQAGKARTGNSSRLRSHHTTTTPAVSTHSPTIFRHTARHPGPASFLDSVLINDSRLSTPVYLFVRRPLPSILPPRLATRKKETKPFTPPAHITPPPAPPGCRRRLSCQSASHQVTDRASRPPI